MHTVHIFIFSCREEDVPAALDAIITAIKGRIDRDECAIYLLRVMLRMF